MNVLIVISISVLCVVFAPPTLASPDASSVIPTLSESGSGRPPVSDKYLRRVVQALELAERSGGDAAEPALSKVLADPAFKKLSSGRRYGLLIAAAYGAAASGKAALARDRFAQAVALDPDEPNAWYWLALTEADVGNGKAAAVSLTRFATRWPELVNQVEARQVWYVASISSRGSDEHLDLLQAFFDAGWNRSPASASNLFWQLALLRLERGEIAGASAATARVNHPTDVVSMLMDNRFAPLISDQREAWDPLAKGNELLAVLRERAVAAPTELAVQTELLEAMLVLGLHQEVLDISTPILQAIKAGDPAYGSASMSNWVANHRALALLGLGRAEEGLAQLVEASEIAEGEGFGNVSQVLNLAELYGRLDRSEDALATLGRVAEMSDYGRMVEASIRHRASVRRGDEPTSIEALAYLREHRSKAPQLFLQALLTADLEDEVTVATVELLRSDEHRADTLRWLQDLKQPPTLKGEEGMRERWLSLRQRAEVKTEVERWGNLGTYPIFGA